MVLEPQLIEKFKPLQKPWRYKVFYGGRGGAKSWQFARILLLLTMSKELRILCTREIQGSIKESVHKLLKNQISLLGLDSYFDIKETKITNLLTNSEFFFIGAARNISQIKSVEGIDICWFEEAEKGTKDTWDTLIPTIRKDTTLKFKDQIEVANFLEKNPGLNFPEYLYPENGKDVYTVVKPAEIWISFNPQYEDDETYKRFVINPPPNALVVNVNYWDNPEFTATMRSDMNEMKLRDYDEYLHIYEGNPRGGGGLFWTRFDKNVHVKDFSMEEIAEKGNCFMSMDPHSKYYPFIIWLAILPKTGNNDEFFYVIYNEYPTFDDFRGFYSDFRDINTYGKSLQNLSEDIYLKDGFAMHGIKIINRFVDTRFAKGSGGTNWSTKTDGLVESFSKPENGGIYLNCPPERLIDIQKDIIQGKMEYNLHQPVTQFNCPDFYVMPHCKNTINSLQFHRYCGNTQKQDEKYKDPSDAIRIGFAGLNDYKYKDPTVKRVKKINRRVRSGWMG